MLSYVTLKEKIFNDQCLKHCATFNMAHEIVQQVEVPASRPNVHDTLIWKSTKSEHYTVKLGYHAVTYKREQAEDGV
jgi:hypothetical protein